MACRNLLAALPRVVAVVRPDDAALAAALGAAGARIVRCASADDGMGASLACGVLATRDAAGWVVALGDMPWIETSTIARVAAAIADGAAVAAPFHRGQRGHPVGFGAACFAALAALTGDEGAKIGRGGAPRQPRADRRRRCRHAARRRPRSTRRSAGPRRVDRRGHWPLSRAFRLPHVGLQQHGARLFLLRLPPGQELLLLERTTRSGSPARPRSRGA